MRRSTNDVQVLEFFGGQVIRAAALSVLSITLVLTGCASTAQFTDDLARVASRNLDDAVRNAPESGFVQLDDGRVVAVGIDDMAATRPLVPDLVGPHVSGLSDDEAWEVVTVACEINDLYGHWTEDDEVKGYAQSRIGNEGAAGSAASLAWDLAVAQTSNEVKQLLAVYAICSAAESA